MSIAKISTKQVVTIGPNASVRDAAKQMRDFHVGDVVVVDERDGKSVPVGILTDRDIVVSTTAFGLEPQMVSVGDVMSTTLVCARLTDSVWHILSIMKEHGVKRLPLVNEVGELTGIVSSDDVIGLLGAELTEIGKIQEKQRVVETERRRKFA
jgi:CBS domain-containing protein